MKKILLMTTILKISLLANFLDFDRNFISFGSGFYQSNQHASDEGSLNVAIGVKGEKSKLYLYIPRIYFENQKEEEENFNAYSLNYDYYFYERRAYKFYLGGGLNYSELDLDSKSTDEENDFNFNLQTGFEVKKRGNVGAVVGIEYYDVGGSDVSEIYGLNVRLEYSF